MNVLRDLVFPHNWNRLEEWRFRGFYLGRKIDTSPCSCCGGGEDSGEMWSRQLKKYNFPFPIFRGLVPWAFSILEHGRKEPWPRRSIVYHFFSCRKTFLFLSPWLCLHTNPHTSHFPLGDPILSSSYWSTFEMAPHAALPVHNPQPPSPEF